MNRRTPPARRAQSLLATLLGTLLFLAAVLVGAAPVHAAALSISYTPKVVSDGVTISVHGNAGGPNAPLLYVAVCEAAPTASNCDQSISGFGTPTAHILQVAPDPVTGAWGPFDFYVRQTIVTGTTPGGFDCKAAGSCVIGTTNSANPKDHSYNVTALLDFGTASTASPTASPTKTASPTSSPTPTQTSSPTMSPTKSSGGLGISYSPPVVADGVTIKVRGNAGRPNAPDLYVAVCEAAPTATNCDQSLAGVGTPTAHILQVSPDKSTGAWGPVDFYVRQVITTGSSPGGFDCKKAGSCVIGTTNSVNPKDHTYNVTTPLSFSSAAVPTLPDALPDSDGKLTVEGASALAAGAKVKVTGSGFAPNTPVAIGLYSAPVTLGSLVADDAGVIAGSVPIPADATGEHTLVAFGSDPDGDDFALTAAVTVVAASSASPSTEVPSDGSGGEGGGDGSTLAATGAAGTGPLLASAGLAVLLAGLILLVAAGRPARRH